MLDDKPALRAMVFRVDITSGRRTLLREMTSVDRGGFVDWWARTIRVTIDGKLIATSEYRALSDLFIVDGLK
jgi:hypothetical protein